MDQTNLFVSSPTSGIKGDLLRSRFSKEQGPQEGGILLDDILMRMSKAAAAEKTNTQRMRKMGGSMQGSDVVRSSAAHLRVQYCGMLTQASMST